MIRGNLLTPRQTVALLILLASLTGALGIVINCLHGENGRAMAPQLDTLIFHQYARAMSEGRPYQFNPGDPLSTGSTSHLLPALLAVFHKLGLRGDALNMGALLLNFACYLASILFLYAIARRLDPRAAPLAALLCALSGQTFISFFLLTDIGLFTALALGALAAALADRRLWLCLALALAACCRPEGFILSALLLAAALAPASWPIAAASPHRRRSFLLAGALGVASFGALLVLNRILTGSFQFQSVQGKGLVQMRGLCGGVYLASRTVADALMQGLFGLGQANRSFYFFPLLGGALGLLGVASRRWRRRFSARIELWWAVAALAGIGLSATSGWDGLQYDKYWTWFLPVWAIYIAIGLRQVARRLRWSAAAPLLVILLLGYQAMGWAHFLTAYARDCASMTPMAPFLRRVDATLPPKARVGCKGGCGLAYYLADRSLFNLPGICAPQYSQVPTQPCQTLELLRHRPDLRFDYWLINAPDSEEWFKPAVGAQLAAASPVFGGTFAFTLHRAVWDALNGTTQPLTAGLAPPAARLVDSLDVGYAPDEARCAYDLYTRFPGASIDPMPVQGQLGGRSLAEIGRVVIGSETFQLRARPGRPARLVLRGMLKGEAVVLAQDYSTKSQSFDFSTPLKLNVLVDDQPAGQWVIESQAKDENIFERSFEIPAALLTSDHPLITVGGDHIALGYWLYQE